MHQPRFGQGKFYMIVWAFHKSPGVNTTYLHPKLKAYSIVSSFRMPSAFKNHSGWNDSELP